MLYDELTLYIISSIYEAHLKKEKIATWTLAKNRDWSDKPLNMKNRDAWKFYQKKNMLIIKRLQCMAKEGILIIEKINGSLEFTIIKDKVLFFQRFKFPCGYRRAIMINRFNDKWIIYQV